MGWFKKYAEVEITHGGNLRELELCLFDTLPDGKRRLFPLTLRNDTDHSKKIKLTIVVEEVCRYGRTSYFVKGKVASTQENFDALLRLNPNIDVRWTEIWAKYSPGNRKGRGRVMCEC
ncbi:TPA: hypothetical protein DCG61_00115 [Patescibacteria group bacterium]|jgi:hypothetical protein|nr:hypothetical protein [Patescibacteria group bacterium]